MKNQKNPSQKYCPECGGVFFSGHSLQAEHHDSQCSMRWVNQHWVPKDSQQSKNKELVIQNLWWNQ